MRISTIFLLLTTLFSASIQAADIIIGTGSKSGVYFQAGRVLCRQLERHLDGIDCQAEESAGSVSNLNNIQIGALELGLVQSDIQYHAVNRSGPYQFVDRSYENLRSLFSLYSEPFTLVARRDAGIATLDDLQGRRVNIGNVGSGQRATMEVVMQAKGWSKDTFQLVTELPASQQSFALCLKRIEAMVYTVGHPNRSVAKAIELCNGMIAEVADPVIDKLVAEHPYYSQTEIPAGIYSGIDEPVKTFGVLATLVSSSDVDEELIYKVVKTVFDNFDSFQRMHLLFRNLQPEAMVKEGLSAPLHKGAERYYRERGWIK